MTELVAIARITRPRGIKGEVVADVLTDFPERFDELVNVIGVRPDETRFDLKIDKHWFQSGRMVLKFAGFDNIDAAEPLRGVEICVPEDDAVELEDGEFFDWQLEGCVVETVDGVPIGTVRELMRTGGTELLVVTGGDKEYLVPFAESICTEVDADAKRIVIDPPDGLLDL